MGTSKKAELETWADIPEEALQEIKDLKRRLSAAERKVQRLRSGEAIITQAVESVLCDLEPLKVRPPAKNQGKGVVEEAVAHLSDIQYGKVTATYDTVTADQRLALYFDKLFQITEARRTMAKIDTLRVFLGGDMVEGEEIFPGQAHEIEMSVFDQALVNLPETLNRQIMRSLDHFKHIVVDSVPGNHGRPGKKSGNQHPKTNWDRVLYHAMRGRLLGGDENPNKEMRKRVTFNISDSWYTVVRVQEWGILLIHGDQIVGHAGIPWYGANRRAAGWADAIREPWDVLVYGHYHTPAMATVNRRFWMCNGSTESDNEFARSALAASGYPCQRLFYMNKSHGLVADHLVYLDNTRTPAPSWDR